MDTSDVIYFYDVETEFVKKEHIFLNNFEPSPFLADDFFTYPSVEHYYQCHKFDNYEEHPEFKAIFEEIRSPADPLASKKLARKYEKEFEGKWQKEKWENGYKDYIMKRGLVFKFSQNKHLLDELMKTGSSKLVERSQKDPYWGGFLPNSKNKLGQFLAEVRDNYAKEGKIFAEGTDLDKFSFES